MTLQYFILPEWQSPSHGQPPTIQCLMSSSGKPRSPGEWSWSHFEYYNIHLPQKQLKISTISLYSYGLQPTLTSHKGYFKASPYSLNLHLFKPPSTDDIPVNNCKKIEDIGKDQPCLPGIRSAVSLHLNTLHSSLVRIGGYLSFI